MLWIYSPLADPFLLYRFDSLIYENVFSPPSLRRCLVKKTTLLVFLLCCLPILFGGCGWEKPLKVGVTAGPHAEIMWVVKGVAEKNGLNIEIVEYPDYVQPNVALTQGSIDANSFQPLHYLEATVLDRRFDIAPVARTVLFPMGIYSGKAKTFADVTPGALVAIPDDPANIGRALLLLEKLGLVGFRPGAGPQPSIADIVDNPQNLVLREFDAAQIPRLLNEADLAAINSSYASAAGLIPGRDALAIEGADSPYVNVIVVRSQDKDLPAVKKLIEAYQSEEVKRFIAERYGGAVLPAW